MESERIEIPYEDCNNQGRIFSLANRLGHDMNTYARRYMKSKFVAQGKDFDYSYYQIASPSYSLDLVDEAELHEEGARTDGISNDEAYWIGFFYKYFALSLSLTNEQAWEKIPFGRMRAFYAEYGAAPKETAGEEMTKILRQEMAAGKPHVVILATGGTIAGSAPSAASVIGYRAGVLNVDEMLAAVPELADIADVRGETICAIDSKDMTDEIWLRLTARVNELLASDDADGVVIAHGTDTLEETAYFLQLTVKSDRPVVLTGAMRPATALSADGPMNLLGAVRVAACREAAGKGALVVMNGEIHSARDVTKTRTLGVDAFSSPALGCLGIVDAGVPIFYRVSVRRHTTHSEFEAAALPRVDILYGYAGDDGALVDACVRAGAKGIVYAGMGNGSIPADVEKTLVNAAEEGVAVVRASRGMGGTAVSAEPSYDAAGFIASDTLSPQKARVLLRLALAKTNDVKELRRIFQEY